MQKLDVEDQYNATIIEPIFPMDSWYADNPNDPTINYETFVADILPQWVDSNFSTTGTEKNLLVGFSKSGYGALDLELKHPSVFSAVAAFDFPGDMTSYDDYGSSSANDYGTQANFQNNYQLTSSFIDAIKRSSPPKITSSFPRVQRFRAKSRTSTRYLRRKASCIRS